MRKNVGRCAKNEATAGCLPKSSIADGHHRSAAASLYAKEHGFEGESRWFMAVIFPASQLKILAYNRLVADLNGLSDYEFMSRVSENFEIGRKGERNCRMYFRGKWTDLSWSIPAGTDVVGALDVSYLQTGILARRRIGIGVSRSAASIRNVERTQMRLSRLRLLLT